LSWIYLYKSELNKKKLRLKATRFGLVPMVWSLVGMHEVLGSILTGLIVTKTKIAAKNQF
jgi:hypothetical protein